MASAITFYPPRGNRVGGFIIAVAINGLGIWLLLLTPRHAVRPPDNFPGTEVQILPPDAPPLKTLPLPAKPAVAISSHKPVHSPTVVPPVHTPRDRSAAHTQERAITPDQPAANASAKPALDMESLRGSIKADMRHSAASEPQKLDLSLTPVAPSSAMAREMKKAVRQSCGSAHANALLLAPLLILKDTLTDSGCTLQP
ncbi:hypothetical protein [Silvimonas sp.]|uniref:hypothetical protein n=1 Tax=Silvimonas sp. TaxID=2650811 RepID=UPI00284EB54F|nr:hypothetical protein [Silvimonas sp.]MDR3428373.1 hypothetical protein [Silvimonas sp.]